MNSKLSHILALSGEAALFVEQGRIVYGNAGAERLLGPCLGRQAAELLGAEYSAGWSSCRSRRRHPSSSTIPSFTACAAT